MLTEVVQLTNTGDFTIVTAGAITGACAIIASGIAGWFSYRGMKAAGRAEQNAREANHAVNGAPSGDPTIRESVNALKDGVATIQEVQATTGKALERLAGNLDDATRTIKMVGGEVSGIASRQKNIEAVVNSRLNDQPPTSA
jgi:hypothetical protein